MDYQLLDLIKLERDTANKQVVLLELITKAQIGISLKIM